MRKNWNFNYTVSEAAVWVVTCNNMAELTIVQEHEGEFSGPRHALIHGVRVTFYEPNIDKDFEKDLCRFETRADDIYVVSYPKSGKAL